MIFLLNLERLCFIVNNDLVLHFVIALQSQVFAVAFALLAAGAVILTLNVLLLVISSLSLTHKMQAPNMLMWKAYSCVNLAIYFGNM